jgi:hypothetical protein
MSDTHAIDHRAVLQPVTVKPIQRPAFDNTHLGQPRSWINDNSLTLARYFYELGGKKIAPTPGADLQLWTKVQHELEIKYQARARLPHGSGEL